MGEMELFSSLVGNVYDAALDPSLWQAALRQATLYIGGVAAALYSKDATARTGAIFYQDGGIDPRYVDIYFEKYVKLYPLSVGHFFSSIEQPISVEDIVPYDEFRDTRFYKEWVKPQRLVDHLVVALDKSVTTAALFGVFRSEREGSADDAMRRRMRLLAPHIRRSVLVSRLFDLKIAEAATLATAFDGLSAGMFLIDAAGRIVHANAAGHAILQADDYLRAIEGRLSASDPQRNQLLRDIINAAAGGDEAVGIKGIAIPFVGRDGERHVTHVLPLTSGARSKAGRAFAAVAALFVHRTSLDTPSPAEVIARAYRLTPTELRVLLAIVEVGGVPEVAEALGIAVHTVKKYLASIYEKTGVHRQADLVKIGAGFSSPLLVQSK
jgi:DNA-binding CsgD family transcriptional regulator